VARREVLADPLLEAGELDRLVDEFESPELRDARLQVRSAEGGHHEAGYEAPSVHQLSDELNTVHPRHLDVGEDQVDWVALEDLERFDPVAGGDDLVSSPANASTRLARKLSSSSTTRT
jgi:hypothetical protein